jgi:hypothetical protein
MEEEILEPNSDPSDQCALFLDDVFLKEVTEVYAVVSCRMLRCIK